MCRAPLFAILLLSLEAVAAPPTIEVTDPGVEPRALLRYRFAEGTQERLVMDMGTSITMRMGSMALPAMTMPTSRMHMVVDLLDVRPGGELSYAFRLEGAEVLETPGAAPETLPAMAAELEKMVGLRGAAVVSARGFGSKASLELPAGASEQMRQIEESLIGSIEQLSSPLPEEPVGQGAKWTVSTELDLATGLHVRQVSRFEMLSLQGDEAIVRFTLEQSAMPQEIRSPDLPPGAVLRVKSMGGTGSGESRIHLARVVPTARTSLTSASEMEVSMGGEAQEMATQLSVTLDVRPE